MESQWREEAAGSLGALSALSWAKEAERGFARGRDAGGACAYPLGAFAARLSWSKEGRWRAGEAERMAIAAVAEALRGCAATQDEADAAWERFWMGYSNVACRASQGELAQMEGRWAELSLALGEEGLARCARGVERVAWRCVLFEEKRGVMEPSWWEPQGVFMFSAMRLYWKALEDLASRGLCSSALEADFERRLARAPKMPAQSPSARLGLVERALAIKALQERVEIERLAPRAEARLGSKAL